MEEKNRIFQRSDNEWLLAAVQLQVKDLQREKEHLDSKKLQRPLNGWEISRCEALLDEVMELLAKIGKLKIGNLRRAA